MHGGQFQVHLLVQGIIRFAQPLPDHPAHDPGEDRQQGPGVQAGDRAIPDLPGGQGGDGGQDGQLPAQDLGVDGDGADDRRDPQDQGDIGDIGAIGVAQGDAGATLPGGQGGDHQFRRGGAETHDDHPDQPGRHPVVSRRGGGAIDKTVRAPDQESQTQDKGNSRKQHGGFDRRRQRGASYPITENVLPGEGC